MATRYAHAIVLRLATKEVFLCIATAIRSLWSFCKVFHCQTGTGCLSPFMTMMLGASESERTRTDSRAREIIAASYFYYITMVYPSVHTIAPHSCALFFVVSRKICVHCTLLCVQAWRGIMWRGEISLIFPWRTPVYLWIAISRTYAYSFLRMFSIRIYVYACASVSLSFSLTSTWYVHTNQSPKGPCKAVSPSAWQAKWNP